MATRLTTHLVIALLVVFAFLTCGPVAQAQVSAPYLVENVGTTRKPNGAVNDLVTLDDEVIFTAPGLLGRSDGTFAGSEVLQTFEGLTPQELATSPDRDRLYFRAANDLWVTDGTRPGTLRLAGGIRSFGNPTYLRPGTGELYFLANVSADGGELRRTDGTVDGTVTLLDGIAFEVGVEVAGGVVFLAAGLNPADGPEVWITDGTPQGTHPFTDFNPSPASNIRVRSLAPMGDHALFVVADETFDEELWITDGTAAGTARLWRNNQGAGNVADILADEDRAYATVSDVVTGLRVVFTEGTPESTTELSVPELPQLLAVLDGRLLFSARTAETGFEPWVSDGTQDGTLLLNDVCPGSCGSFPEVLAQTESLVFLSMDDGSTGRELFATGLRFIYRFLEVCPGPCSSNPRAGTAADDRLVFFADGAQEGEELYAVSLRTGLDRLTDLDPPHPFPSQAAALLDDRVFYSTVGDGALFVETVPVDPPAGPVGTGRRVLLRLPLPVEDLSSFPNGFSHRDETLYFAAYDSPSRLGLYRRPPAGPSVRLGTLSDDTRDGRGRFHFRPTYTEPVAGGVFALAPVGEGGQRLWFSDGISGGTMRLLLESPDWSLYPRLWPLDDGVAFVVLGSNELWFTDGTFDGTRRLAGGIRFGGGDPVALFQGSLYFAHEEGFWLTGGSPQTTGPVFRLGDGRHGASLLAADDQLFFEARTDEGKSELFVYDGGPTLGFGPVDAPGLGQVFRWLAGRDGVAYLSAGGPTDAGTDGEPHLWRVSAEPAEGVDLGVPFRAAIDLDRSNEVPTAFAGDVFYGLASDGRLVRSDGTPEGTGVLSLLPSGAFAGALASLPGDRVLYAQSNAGDPDQAPYRLWITDGTAIGTRLLGELQDIGPELHLAGDRVYFSGLGLASGVGEELWAVDLRSPRVVALPPSPRVCDPERGALCL